MPTHFNYGHYIYPSTAQSWWQIANEVRENGHNVSPRGLETRELIGASLKFLKPQMNYINPKGRNLNLPFAIAEFTDYLMGNNPGNCVLFNSKMADFINPMTKKLDGAYGSRIRPLAKPESSQFVRCAEELKREPESRRAVITIHNPLYENFSGKDVACTLSLQFLIRDSCLHMITTMRSEDVYLGFCYDTFEFQLMQKVMASLVDVPVGQYYHNVGSLHFYVSDTEKLKAIDPLVIPYRHEEMPAPISYENYYSFERDLTILNYIASQARKPPTEIHDVFDAPYHVSEGYMMNCALVLAAEVMRRNNKTSEAQTLARDITNEFMHYFDRYWWPE